MDSNVISNRFSTSFTRILGIAFAFVWLSACSLNGARVTLKGSADAGEIGPYGPIVFEFSFPIELKNLEGLLEISPEMPGGLAQVDERTAQFVPLETLQAQASYTVKIASGVIGVNGEALANPMEWTLRVRSPRVAYVNIGLEKLEIWSMGTDGKDARRLTDSRHELYWGHRPQFSVSPDGERVVYTVVNDRGGLDLWLVDRNGDSDRILLDCKRERCEEPVWSPTGEEIAYTRSTEGNIDSEELGDPRQWLIAVRTGDTHPVHEEEAVRSVASFWSPDGRWLGSYDPIAQSLRVVELSSGTIRIFPCSIDSSGAWTPDGRYLYYLNVIGEDLQKRSVIMRADMTSGETSLARGDTDELDHLYALPSWSPNGDQVVIGWRASPNVLMHSLWIGAQLKEVLQMFPPAQSYSYGNFSWDPWGHAVLLQGSRITLSHEPEMYIWSAEDGLRLLMKNAAFPQWLP